MQLHILTQNDQNITRNTIMACWYYLYPKYLNGPIVPSIELYVLNHSGRFSSYELLVTQDKHHWV